MSRLEQLTALLEEVVLAKLERGERLTERDRLRLDLRYLEWLRGFSSESPDRSGKSGS